MKKESPITRAKLTASSEQRCAAIVRALLRYRGVTGPKKRRGFGSSALWTNEKKFAFMSSKGEFIVKLPRERVDTLVALGKGERCDPARGRPMKEWVALNETSKLKWLDLERESMDFVSQK